MYQLFKEHIRGNVFVEDIDILTSKLAVLNSILLYGRELKVSRYLQILGLPCSSLEFNKIVGRGLIFQYLPDSNENGITDICLDCMDCEE